MVFGTAIAVLTNLLTNMYHVSASWRGYLTVALISLLVLAIIVSVMMPNGPVQKADDTKDQGDSSRRTISNGSKALRMSAERAAGLSVIISAGLVGVLCSCSIQSGSRPDPDPSYGSSTFLYGSDGNLRNALAEDLQNQPGILF